MSSHPEAQDSVEERHRRTLLDAAHRLIEQQGGISLRLDELTLEMVGAKAGVSRATVYRTWPNRDEFETDLLCDLAGPNGAGAGAFDQETINIATRMVAENLDDLATPESRRNLMREVVREAAAESFRAATTSVDWRGYVALSATVMTMSSGTRRDRVTQALQAAEAMFLDKMATFYEDMGLILGLRIREGVGTYRHVAAAGAAVVEGLSIRHLLNPDLVDHPLIVEGTRGPEEWSLAAYSFFGVIEQFTEPDPTYDARSALAAYLLRKSGIS